MKPILLILFITLVTVLGDAFLKKASHQHAPFTQLSFAVGMAVYICTAFLWVYVYKDMKFSQSGVIYSIMSMIIFVAFGIIFFREKLVFTEYIGLILGITSIYLLNRFA